MKKKLLLTSILSIVMCVSLIAGATFALFTSESKVNVAVTSGKVDVVATIDNVELYSPTSIGTDGTILDDTNAATETEFKNGGTVALNGNTIEISNVTPGDKATVTIDVTNNSTVAVKYRTILASVGDLINGLNVTINGTPYTGATSVSAYRTLHVDENGTTITIVIELPSTAGSEYQDKTLTLFYTVEAVQGNAEDDEVQIITLKKQNEYQTHGGFTQKGYFYNKIGYSVEDDANYEIEEDLVLNGVIIQIEDESVLNWGCYYLGYAFVYSDQKSDSDVDYTTRRSITFKNCTFLDKTGKAKLIWGNEFSNVEVVVENCEFIGFQLAFQFGQNDSNTSSYKLKNNSIFAKRGVSLSGKCNVEFNNNTFNLTGGTEDYFLNVASKDSVAKFKYNNINTVNVLKIHSVLNSVSGLDTWNGLEMTNNSINYSGEKAVVEVTDDGGTIRTHFENIIG